MPRTTASLSVVTKPVVVMFPENADALIVIFDPSNAKALVAEASISISKVVSMSIPARDTMVDPSPL